MGKGIDYGMGVTNIDLETGIRYGVIHQYEVLQAWSDSAEADYGPPTCPECGEEVHLPDPENHVESDYEQYKNRGGCDYQCEGCELFLDSDQVFGEEPNHWLFDDGEYRASQGGGDCDIFILKSPYFTRAAYCSPCAPGACHLESPCDDGERCYCFGHDWFENNIAPYPVYSVATGELVPSDCSAKP